MYSFGAKYFESFKFTIVLKKIKYLGLIPAREGSKGVKNKNIHSLGGKPLIQHTFEKAKISSLLSDVHLSSDSNKIIEFSKNYGVKSLYKRPSSISGDKATAIEVIMYHINWLKKNKNILVENIVYLQPTSPIRKNNLIDKVLKKYESKNSISLVTICECSQHPYETIKIVKEKIVEFYNLKSFSRRQDFPKYYFITGSIYVFNVENLIKTKKIINSNTDYYLTSIEEGLDIDNLLDFKLAESLLNSY